jgi:tryptophan-rich sensory protein
VVGLIVSVAVPLALGGIGGAITAGAIPGWYATLAKPSWNPPSWLFGPVWTVLYVAMGVAAWRVWRAGRTPLPPAQGPVVRRALIAYGVQLALNASWTPVFFGLKRIDIALVIIVAMLLAIAETTRRFYRVDRRAALLLLPYLAWVAFATVLNARIWQLNP